MCILIAHAACAETNPYSGYSYILPRCLNSSVGYYPKCECADNYGYKDFEQKCVLRCPAMGAGEYPFCECPRHTNGYDFVTNSCVSPKCPSNTTADSVYPNCQCTGKNYVYNEHLNDCFLACPEDSSGYFPNCKCDDEKKGFGKGTYFLRILEFFSG